MKASLAPLGLAITLGLTLPLMPATAVAQDLTSPPQVEPEDGKGLIERGFDYLFRGILQEVEPQLDDLARGLEDMQPQIRQLFAMIDDLRNYDAPKRLENGDILIPRRKDAPPPPSLPPPSQPPAAEPERPAPPLGSGPEVEL